MTASSGVGDTAVLIIDRARGHRDGLRCAIEHADGLTCAGAAASLAETGHLAADAVGAVIIQAATPGLDLRTEVATASARHPEATVVVVASHADERLAEAMVRQGASAVVSTDVPLLHLVGLVAGRSLHHTDDGAATRCARAAELAQDLGLTSQQLHILRHLADGLSPQQIAHAHDRSVNTVRDHLQRLRTRLRCSNGLELVVTAHHLGLLPEMDRPLR